MSMQHSILHIPLQESLFVKDPTSSIVGKSILEHGLILLSEIGLEDFTFKKLAIKISSTESTIYRYFENKHQFLSYLFNFYWAWMDVNIAFAITNIDNPIERLRRIIRLITKKVSNDVRTPFIDESLLQDVIALESSKTFLSKKVDEENQAGYFLQYKRLVDRISAVIIEINPNYAYPNALVSTVLESSFHQRYFGNHLPRLTNEMHIDARLEDFLLDLCLKTLA
jgi:AcrR family transcriptional regulator